MMNFRNTIPNLTPQNKGILVMPTEVYSRIVGYYRPVQNFNEAKKLEYSKRNNYDKKLYSNPDISQVPPAQNIKVS